MNKSVLGIDLGTSSVKVMKYNQYGDVTVLGEKYTEISINGWKSALLKVLKKMDLSDVEGIGLSSQVGTYIVNGERIISWNEAKGSEELDEIRKKYATDLFMDEISMPHPAIISYPIPRLLYIKRNFEQICEICQPKEKIMEFLTGNMYTDRYSWRGLCNMKSGDYSEFFLEELEVDKNILPPLRDVFAECGRVSTETAKLTGLNAGIPVFNGLNDFYASLLGMGVTEESQIFDITGTSEHIGVIKDVVDQDTSLVSSEYFGNSVNYGVTASSGSSLDFGIKNFGFENVDWNMYKNAPIFTPYLNGERAPIFDTNATGTFFGINGNTTKLEMSYSVLEGVAFSVYHIYETLGGEKPKSITVSGGASKNAVLNGIKATLFDANVVTLEVADTSAMGACIAAMVGMGWHSDLESAIAGTVRTKNVYVPNSNREILLKRFEIYKEIYPAFKDKYKRLKEL